MAMSGSMVVPRIKANLEIGLLMLSPFWRAQCIYDEGSHIRHRPIVVSVINHFVDKDIKYNNQARLSEGSLFT